MVDNINRYRDLLNLLPEGKFFGHLGEVFPYQDASHTLEYTTGIVGRKYTITLNGRNQGEGVTDTNGIVRYATTRNLEPGDYTVKFIDTVTRDEHTAFFSVRHYATFLAAMAEVLERQDAEISDLHRAASLQNVTEKYIETAYGQAVHQSFPSDWQLEEYRRALGQLRAAYRHFGGVRYGVQQAVSALTGSNPVVIPKHWRPRWVPDRQLLENGDFQTRTKLCTEAHALNGLENLNRQSRVYVHPAVPAVGTLTATSLRQPPTPQELMVTVATGTDYALITGIDVDGVEQEDIRCPPPGTSTAGSYSSDVIFASVSAISRTGVGAMSVGLADSKFVSIVKVGDYNLESDTHKLTYDGTNTTLDEYRFSWDNTTAFTGTLDTLSAAQVALGESLTLHGPGKSAVLVSPKSVVTTTAYDLTPFTTGVATTDYHDQLYLEIDGEVKRVSFGSGGTPSTFAASTTVANATSATNTALTGSPATTVTASELDVLQLVGTERVRVLSGPCDAAPFMFGPVSTTRLSSGVAAAATSLVCVDASRIPVGAKIRIRGLRAHPTVTAVAAGTTATFTFSGHTFAACDTAVRLDGGAVGNIGLHRIIAKSGSTATLLHQNAGSGGAFVNSFLPTAVSVYGDGEVLTVASKNSNTLTTTATTRAWGQGAIVELVSAVPLLADAEPGLGTIEITVDPEFRPHHDFGDSLSAPSSNTVTLTSSRAAFTSAVTGAKITITNAENPQNEIEGIAVTYASATTITFTNASGVAETSAFEWALDDWSGAATLVVSDTVTPVGSLMPDGWVLDSSTDATVDFSNVINTAATRQGGTLVPSRVTLSNSAAGELRFWKTAPDALDYLGLPLHVTIWLQEHESAGETITIEVSFDGSDYFTVATDTAAPKTALDTSPTPLGNLNPYSVSGTFYVPYDATTCILRFTRAASTTPLISLEKVELRSVLGSGLYLDSNTIVRNAKLSHFGKLLYAWSPEDLSSEDTGFLGIPATGAIPAPAGRGHIDFVTNAHGYWERADVSEYSGETRQNLRGVYGTDAWETVNLDENLTLLQAFVGTPDRLAFVAPTRPSHIELEEVTFNTSTRVASLAGNSDHEGSYPQNPNSRAALYEVREDDHSFIAENGRRTVIPAGTLIPVPSSTDADGVQPWWFNAQDEIEIHSSYFNADATYFVDYEVLVRATTGAITLDSGALTSGVTTNDYVWMVDAPIYTRHQTSAVSSLHSQQLVFTNSYEATLDERADVESPATLYKDTGKSRTTVDSVNWSFADTKTVFLSAVDFDPTAVYVLEYYAQSITLAAPVECTVEWRGATTTGLLAAASWTTVQDGDIVSPINTSDGVLSNVAYPYHELRVTLNGVTTASDVRIYGLGLKGTHLFGNAASAPGIVLEE